METATGKPVFDTTGKSVAQVGVVVRDAVASAREFSRIFGMGPWTFFDSVVEGGTLHGERIADGSSCVRLASANLGALEFELLQPVYGRSSHREFLETCGEGIHHISLGAIDDHDRFVSALSGYGIELEMNGISSGVVPFSYMGTQRQLGTIFEASQPVSQEMLGALSPWGSYEATEPGLINLEGKKIAQIGFVVADVEKIARNYWEIFGIGPWTFLDYKPPVASMDCLHGVPVFEGTNFHIKVALADFNGMKLELIQPVEGPTPHMDFLKTRGPGVHHLSFDAVDDHDQLVAALGSSGIQVEMSGIVGGAARYTYLATQNSLHTILECVKATPGMESTAMPYGIYPPGV